MVYLFSRLVELRDRLPTLSTKPTAEVAPSIEAMRSRVWNVLLYVVGREMMWGELEVGRTSRSL